MHITHTSLVPYSSSTLRNVLLEGDFFCYRLKKAGDAQHSWSLSEEKTHPRAKIDFRGKEEVDSLIDQYVHIEQLPEGFDAHAQVPHEKIPSTLHRFLSSDVTIACRARYKEGKIVYHFTCQGIPLRATLEYELREKEATADNDSCEIIHSLDYSVNIPLFGSRIEKSVRTTLHEVLRVDTHWIEEYLGQ